MSNKGLITDKFQTAELDLQKLIKGHEKSSCFEMPNQKCGAIIFKEAQKG